MNSIDKDAQSIKYTNRYKLICLDLDGTLLNSKHVISAPTLRILRRAERQGIKIAIVTGRAAYDAKAYAKMISDSTYYIGSNGAIVGRTSDDKIIKETALTCRHLNELLDVSDKVGLKPILFTEDYSYIMVSGIF